MAIIDSSRPAPFGAVSTYRVVSVLERTIDAVKTWNAQRRTAKALNLLTDYQLDDIGLTRGDVDRMFH